MADDNPFSGMRLSEQAGVGKLDQRLFTQEKTPQSPAVAPSVVESSLSPTAETKATAPVAPPPLKTPKIEIGSGKRFDLKEEPLYKATFVFTQDELEALEDLKLELRRDLDKKVTKFDLVRTGLHMLFEDHAEHAGQSYATRKIRRR